MTKFVTSRLRFKTLKFKTFFSLVLLLLSFFLLFCFYQVGTFSHGACQLSKNDDLTVLLNITSTQHEISQAQPRWSNQDLHCKRRHP